MNSSKNQNVMLDCQRHLYQLSEGGTYLNCAYMSPQLKCVEAAGAHALAQKNRPERVGIADFFEPVDRLKAAFAELIGADDPGRIAIMPSVSYGIATVARNLPLRAGQNLVLTHDQFPSNYYAWERLARERGAALRVVAAPATGDRTQGWNAALLAAIDENTAAVALGHVHWTDGTRFDLAALRARSRAVGAWLVIDGTQSVGALPLNVAELQPDALICAGYKWLMGPYGMTLAYMGPALDGGAPIEENWINRRDSQVFRQLVNYQPEYRPAANRYCVGEHSNFLLTPMMEAALSQLLAWGVANIQDYCRRIGAEALDELAALGVDMAPADRRAHHLVGLRLGDAFDEQRLEQALGEQRVWVSVRGAAIRVAPNVYNTPDDFGRLAECIRRAKR